MFGNALYKKLAFLDHKNTDLKESQSYRFSKEVMVMVYGIGKKFGTVLVKNFKFLYLSNLGTFGLEKIFGDVLDRKLASLDHKITYSKKLQNLHFSTGVSPISSFSCKFGLEEVFFDVLAFF